MKRDPDLLRRILLKLESMEAGSGYGIEAADVDCSRADVLIEHFEILIDQNLVRVGENWALGESVYCQGLTSDGHDFVDRVRDPEVWQFVRDGASKVGSWSLKLAIALATKAIEQKANKILGLS